MEIEQVLEELLKKVEAGQLSQKKAGAVRKLQERVAAGRGLTEMQEELLWDLGTECGICGSARASWGDFPSDSP